MYLNWITLISDIFRDFSYFEDSPYHYHREPFEAELQGIGQCGGLGQGTQDDHL